jgi:multiple sugar transport system substrate-binding protein
MALGMVVAACGGTDTSESTESPPDATDDAGAPADTEAPDEPTDDTTASGDPVTIEYFSFSAGEANLPRLEAIAEAFEAENPNIDVELTTAAFDSYFTDLQTRIAGGDAPDAFELNYENFVTYADSGVLLDLAATAPDVVDPSVYAGDAYDVFNYQGTQYGLPGSFSVVVLFYNKDLFDAAGVDYPDASWTWAEELAAAEALTDVDAGVWGDFQPIQFFEFYKVLAQNGGSFFNDDQTEATFNGPEGVEAAEWLVDKVGTVMPGAEQMGGQDDGGLFMAGQTAMWHSGIWMFTAVGDSGVNYDIVVEPGNAEKAAHFFANGVVGSVDTPHPGEVAMWLQYLASSDVMVQQRLEAGWELPAVADDTVLQPYLEQAPPANRAAVFESLESVVTPPVIVDQQQMQDIVTQALEQAVLGQVSVEDALNSAADQVNALLGG